MQAKSSLQRELVDAAAKKAGNDAALAAMIGRTTQFVSNLRHGHKKASLEVAADLASIAEANVPIVLLMTMIDASTEPRKSRLQAQLRAWHGDWTRAASKATEAVKRNP